MGMDLKIELIFLYTLLLRLGRRQVGKAPGFGPGIRWFESSRPSHFFL